MMTLTPQDYGLASRVKLVQIEEYHIGIVRKLKSRILLKDGKKIVEQAQQIQSVNPSVVKVSLIISGPICSKTVRYLEENKIGLVLEQKEL